MQRIKHSLLVLCAAAIACLGIYEGGYALTDGHSFVRAFMEREAPKLDRDGLTTEISELG